MTELPELGSAGWWRLIAEGRGNIMGEYRAQRDEAREIARELAEFIRSDFNDAMFGNMHDGKGHAGCKPCAAYRRIRPGVRKYLEGG